MRYRLAAVTVLVLVVGCDAASRPEAEGSRDAAGLAQASAPVAAPRAEQARSRDIALVAPSDTASSAPTTNDVQSTTDAAATMLIRTGVASVEVDSLEVAVAQVRQLAQRVGGYIANTMMQSGREQMRQATLEIKMPAQRFDQAVSGLAPIGRVESVNVDAQDVGEEFVDVTARVANSRRLEARLIELLANRTGRLQDVLSVERELARVREEIERYEGRLRYLRSRTATSTLTVTVHEPLPIVGEYPGSSVIGDAFRQAWRNFVALIAWLIASLGVLVPVAVLALLARLLFVRFWNRRPPRSPGESKA